MAFLVSSGWSSWGEIQSRLWICGGMMIKEWPFLVMCGRSNWMLRSRGVDGGMRYGGEPGKTTLFNLLFLSVNFTLDRVSPRDDSRDGMSGHI